MHKIKVKILYRNYKPIHATYTSLLENPPEGVNYVIPKVRKDLKLLLPIYRKFGDMRISKKLMQFLQRQVFEKGRLETDNIDLLHYVQMLPKKLPDKPFIIDIEHAAALFNFSKFSREDISNLISTLQTDQCKQVIALSEAAKQSILKLTGNDSVISKKISVIYPAVKRFYEAYNTSINSNYIKPGNGLNILFVGSHPANKGLFELLETFNQLQELDLNLHIISNASKKLISKFTSPKIHFYPSEFDREEIVKSFYLPADVFIMPTRGDTFGMAFLDALASKTPVITTKQYACKEIIKDGQNGFLIDSENLYLEKYPMPSRKIVESFSKRKIEGLVVEQLVIIIKRLYNDRELLKAMSVNALLDFRKGGKFSIEKRNEQLTHVYEKALNS
ncbi:glycosyltransferase family 4 protein [Candidatus Dojkabacteria bacterium]|nr:glycosyltransferase family 4 protein [Candidatus Dojkabacteria bacterium]